jgi:bla regulator protein blaR1
MRTKYVAPAVFAAGGLLQLAFAQSPAFAIASVKPNSDGDYRVYVSAPPGGRFSANGITLRLLMRYGYDIQDFQIAGGPRWIGSDRWNIEAKAEGVSGALSGEREMQIIRTLLADRFQLRVHSEKNKPVPAYALVIGKYGPKLTENSGEPGPDVRLTRGHLDFKKVHLAALAAQLTRQLGRQVLDRTSLPGEYDFTLDWTPAPGEFGALPGQPGPPETDAGAEKSGPSIFTALQEQLGLRLLATKAPLDVLLIDHVEKPNAN